MSIKWRGAAVLARVENATKRGIDKTMAEAVVNAKSNHPGWKNVTGTAEGSVRIGQFAERDAAGFVGRWGSVGGTLTREGRSQGNYVIFLELKHGSFLRNAAARTYRRLAGYIKDGLR